MARSSKPQVRFSAPVVLGVLLSRFESIQFPPEDAEKRLLNLDLAVSPAEPGVREGTYFSQVMCRCQRVGQEDASDAFFVAIYNVMFGAEGKDTDQVINVAKSYVASAAWTHFTALFTLANGQMKTDMPDLPFAPKEVDVRSREELITAFDFLDVAEAEDEEASA